MVTASKAYDAFGTNNGVSGADPIPYGFAGERFDSDSRLAYHGARWLDSRTGRFLGMDPVVRYLDAGRINHAYVYADNNPVQNVDPTGLEPISGVNVSFGFVGVSSEPDYFDFGKTGTFSASDVKNQEIYWQNMPLSVCTRQILRPYFPGIAGTYHDFIVDELVVNSTNAVLADGDLAQTRGDGSIRFSSGNYQPWTIFGTGVIAHEVRHYQQFLDPQEGEGKITAYAQWLRDHGKNPKSRKDNKYEGQAFDKEDEVVRNLNQMFLQAAVPQRDAAFARYCLLAFGDPLLRP